MQVEIGDVLGVADHLSLLIAISSPKLTPEERELLAIPAMKPGKDRHGEKSRELFSECMRILSELLCILSEKNLYAYKEVPIGDASDLALIEVPSE